MSTSTPRTDDQIGYEGSTMSFVRIAFARTLETELTAANARIAELERSRDLAREDANNNAVNGARALEALEDLTRQLSESQAQLASAREAIESILGEAAFEGLPESKQESLRSAIDSARGVTSPPSVAETGEKDAWQDISTAPKDGTRVIGFSPDWVHEDYNSEGLRECFCDGDGVWYSPDWDNEFDVYQNGKGQPTHWTALPPPPQGKEARE